MSKEKIIHTTQIEARTFVQSAFLIPNDPDRKRMRSLFNGAIGEDGDELLEIQVLRTVNENEE